MAALARVCHNHPDRRAMAVCVVTGQAICSECSTRYEGVNYSKEGLAILQTRRAQADRQGGVALRLATVGAVLLTPVLLGLAYLFYRLAFEMIIDLQQVGA